MQFFSLFLALELQHLKILEFIVTLLSFVSKSNITHAFISRIEDFYGQKLKVIVFSFHCIFLKLVPGFLLQALFWF